jgi:hypothetical protein
MLALTHGAKHCNGGIFGKHTATIRLRLYSISNTDKSAGV